uniref:Glucosylceramidase n=1 Tax=Graphocephala atropunctata TaxID=36148 RepID=A0A1B6LL69_9HEMI
MQNGYKIVFACLSVFMVNLVGTQDIPCAKMMAVGGYVCVCNETYCDTVERPSPLPRRQYYYYMTSEDSPGFTKTVGTFINTTVMFSNISSDVYIRINSSIQYQTFAGIGASFTQSSGSLFNNLSTEAQEKLLESFFGPSGLEYTLGRVPMASSDFSQRDYTYDDVAGDVELKYFNLTEDDLIYKIPIIKRAIAKSQRGLKLIATPWTAPSWMKTNNASKQGYIRSQYLETWSKYFLKFLEAYSSEGIEYWGISHGNEYIIPLYFGSFFHIPNTVMMPAQARYWTKTYLGPMLKASPFKDIKLLSLEDERPFLNWWADRLYADKEVAQYVDGIALHWYFDNNRSVVELEAFNQKYPDKMMIYTESSINSFQSSGGGTVNLGDWSRALRYINNVYQNLDHWVIGYLDWNIVLNDDGGPTGSTGITLDASVIINTTNGEFYKQPIFYALGHFSKFMPPGSKKINVIIDQDTYKNDGGEVGGENDVLQEILRMDSQNLSSSTDSPFPTRKPDPPSHTILALASTNPDGHHTLIAYNPRAVPANLIVTDDGVGTFNQTVPPHSLNSFVYW